MDELKVPPTVEQRMLVQREGCADASGTITRIHDQYVWVHVPEWGFEAQIQRSNMRYLNIEGWVGTL